jgi:hypothetical protein
VGLSSFTLDGASPSFQSFALGIGNGNQCFYTIENDADLTWEVGIGTVSGASLSRDSALSSSNGGAPVNFAAGTKQVFATEAAQHFNDTLTDTTHATIDHSSGVLGVPAPEAFTTGVHQLQDHAGILGVPAAETYDQSTHDADDHTGATLIAPPSQVEAEAGTSTTARLWTAERVNDAIAALGSGAESYDQAAHDADDHTGATLIAPPSQAVAEAGTETVARLWTALRVAQAVAAQTGLQVATQFFAAINTIAIPTGFTPKLAIFVGRYDGLSTPNTIGYAVGTGGSNQGCVVAGALESLVGFIAADSGGDVGVDEAHEVTIFNGTTVTATQTTGATAWTGFVVVLGG